MSALVVSGCYWADEQAGEAYSTVFPPGNHNSDESNIDYRDYMIHIWKPTRGFNGAKMATYKRTLGGQGSGAEVEVECRTVPPSENPFALDDLWVVLNRDKVNTDSRTDRWLEAGVYYECDVDGSGPTGTLTKHALAVFYPHRYALASGDRRFRAVSLSLGDTGLADFQIYMGQDCHNWKITYNGSVLLELWTSFCDYAEEYHAGLETNAGDAVTWLKKNHNHQTGIQWWSGTGWVNGGRPLVRRDSQDNVGGHGMSTNDEVHTCIRVSVDCH